MGAVQWPKGMNINSANHFLKFLQTPDVVRSLVCGGGAGKMCDWGEGGVGLGPLGLLRLALLL